MKKSQKTGCKTTAFAKHGLSVLMLVFTLTASAKSNINVVMHADTIPNENKIYSQVETQPEFPGGLEAFGKFLGQNVHYPATMREKMVEGKVIVQFVVEIDGSLSNIKAIHGPGYGASEEAERVLNLSPKWNPGIQKGKLVRVAYTVPINFTLNRASSKN
ncbi:energy transducer TonB [Mucilaginibacter sp.]|uniref:energy transducer TonB n=1 Tax=Mucilaginibacter sp. TaxID=1882438 RepID=UPI002605E5D8|nr:energy transducer TonB [Mucilaginibacter sp.]MDB5030118.1 Gram-negative bacterial tonB protein [Mucilaginibacter sp.]